MMSYVIVDGTPAIWKADDLGFESRLSKMYASFAKDMCPIVSPANALWTVFYVNFSEIKNIVLHSGN